MFLLDLEVARRLYRDSNGQTINNYDQLPVGVAIAAASHWMTSHPGVTFEQTNLYGAFAEKVSWKEWIKIYEPMECVDWVSNVAIPGRKAAILNVLNNSGFPLAYDNLRKVKQNTVFSDPDHTCSETVGFPTRLNGPCFRALAP